MLTSEDSSLVTTIKTAFDIHGVLSEDEDIDGNRLVVKVFANVVGGGGTVQVVIFQEGNTASHVSLKPPNTALAELFLSRNGTNWMNADLNLGGNTLQNGDVNATGDSNFVNVGISGILFGQNSDILQIVPSVTINPTPSTTTGLYVDQFTAGQQYTGTSENVGVDITHKVVTPADNVVFASRAIKTILTVDYDYTGSVGAGTKLNQGNLVNTLVTGNNDADFASGGSESNAGALVVVSKSGTMNFTGAYQIENAGGFYQVTDNTQGGGTAATDVIVNNFGGKFIVGGSGRKNGAGSLTRNNYGAWFQVTAGGNGATATAYGIYLDTVDGLSNSYGIYDASGANWVLDADNQSIYFGEDQNANILYDGSQFLIDSASPISIGNELTNYNANSVLVQDLNVLGDANIANLTISGVTFNEGGMSVTGDSNFVNVGASGVWIEGDLTATGSLNAPTVNVTTLDLGTNTITDGTLTGAWASTDAITIRKDVDGDFNALIIRNADENPNSSTVRVQGQFKSSGEFAGSMGWFARADFGVGGIIDDDSSFFITTVMDAVETTSFIIDQDGDVLIGASAINDIPSAKLEVIGDTRLEGDLNVAGNDSNIHAVGIGNAYIKNLAVLNDFNGLGNAQVQGDLNVWGDLNVFANTGISGYLTATQIGIGGTPTSPLHIIPSATDSISIFLAGNDNPLVSAVADQFGIFSTRQFTPPGDGQPRITGINSAVAITHNITTGGVGFTDLYKATDNSIVVDSAHSVAAGIIPVITENTITLDITKQ